MSRISSELARTISSLRPKHYPSQIFDLILNASSSTSLNLVVDIGTGDGRALTGFHNQLQASRRYSDKNLQYVAVDSSETQLEEAKLNLKKLLDLKKDPIFICDNASSFSSSSSPFTTFKKQRRAADVVLCAQAFHCLNVKNLSHNLHNDLNPKIFAVIFYPTTSVASDEKCEKTFQIFENNNNNTFSKKERERISNHYKKKLIPEFEQEGHFRLASSHSVIEETNSLSWNFKLLIFKPL